MLTIFLYMGNSLKYMKYLTGRLRVFIVIII